jgi:hypothetical protein
MLPIPEAEALRIEIQQTHIAHVRGEIDLVFTFLELGEVEYHLREERAGSRSLHHAQQAFDGARRGLRRIDSQEIRTALEGRLYEAEFAIHFFAACHAA